MVNFPAFARQAVSDWETYVFLRDERNPPVECHELHYLQMATEKLAKAFMKVDELQGYSHVVFVRFLQQMRHNKWFREQFGCEAKTAQFRQLIEGCLPMARAVEKLAPSSAGDGPNPEYPWPSKSPKVAPVDHKFNLRAELDLTSGKQFLEVVSNLIKIANRVSS